MCSRKCTRCDAFILIFAFKKLLQFFSSWFLPYFVSSTYNKFPVYRLLYWFIRFYCNELLEVWEFILILISSSTKPVLSIFYDLWVSNLEIATSSPSVLIWIYIFFLRIGLHTKFGHIDVYICFRTYMAVVIFSYFLK